MILTAREASILLTALAETKQKNIHHLTIKQEELQNLHSKLWDRVYVKKDKEEPTQKS